MLIIKEETRTRIPITQGGDTTPTSLTKITKTPWDHMGFHKVNFLEN